MHKCMGDGCVCCIYTMLLGCHCDAGVPHRRVRLPNDVTVSDESFRASPVTTNEAYFVSRSPLCPTYSPSCAWKFPYVIRGDRAVDGCSNAYMCELCVHTTCALPPPLSIPAKTHNLRCDAWTVNRRICKFWWMAFSRNGVARCHSHRIMANWS